MHRQQRELAYDCRYVDWYTFCYIRYISYFSIISHCFGRTHRTMIERMTNGDHPAAEPSRRILNAATITCILACE